MPFVKDLSPELLKIRHRLSDHQINNLLGKSTCKISTDEKLAEMSRVAEFLFISDLFTSAGINYISFKGPILSYRIYNDATCRYFNDFDILVDSSSLDSALKILIENGYTTPYFKMPIDECRKKILCHHINEIYLYNSEKSTSIEIHWALFSGILVSEPVMNDTINNNIMKIKFTGREFTVFKPEFDLLYLVIHGGLHYFRRLKWLLDIRDFLKNVPVDESRFRQLTLLMNATRMVAICNEILRIYFPESRLLPSSGKPPEQMVKYAKHQISLTRDEYSKRIPEFIRGLWYTLRAFPGYRYRESIIRSLLFATDLASDTRIPCVPVVYYLISPIYKLYRGFR
jgi:hypothetical protein